MRAGDLAPDDADLGTADLLLAPVDESNLLSEVEAIERCQYLDRHVKEKKPFLCGVDILGGVGVINTLDLDQAGARAGGVTRALVAQVTSPKPSSSVQNSYRIVVSLRAVASRKFDIENWSVRLPMQNTQHIPYRVRRRLGAFRKKACYSLDVYYRQG